MRLDLRLDDLRREDLRLEVLRLEWRLDDLRLDRRLDDLRLDDLRLDPLRLVLRLDDLLVTHTDMEPSWHLPCLFDKAPDLDLHLLTRPLGHFFADLFLEDDRRRVGILIYLKKKIEKYFFENFQKLVNENTIPRESVKLMTAWYQFSGIHNS